MRSENLQGRSEFKVVCTWCGTLIRRSEVKDSHDRYANIEVGYLLQKMEEYDGVVILATNLRKNLDDAFVRRLHVAIDFPFPEEAARPATYIAADLWPVASRASSRSARSWPASPRPAASGSSRHSPST